MAQEDPVSLSQRIDAAAGSLGLEAESVEIPYEDVNTLLRGAAPALLRLPRENGFLALVGHRGRNVLLLSPQLRTVSVRTDVLRAALCAEGEDAVRPSVEDILDNAGVPARRRGRATDAIIRQRLSGLRIDAGWLIRPSPGSDFTHQVMRAGLHRRALGFVGAHAVEYLLLLGAWALLGRGALEGRLERDWLFGWMLLLLTMIPFRLLATWWQGLFAVGVGGKLKQRMLYGAMKVDMDQLRREGAGQLLARVVESEAVESLALGAGISGIFALVELLFAFVVLALGAAGGIHLTLFTFWMVVAAVLGRRYYQQRREWAASRIQLTHDLIERMVGHRTRLAQQSPEHWHEGEDEALEDYLAQSKILDKRGVQLFALLGAGWLILGILGLAPAFVAGIEPMSLAISLGGIMLAGSALTKGGQSLSQFTGAMIAWQQVAPLFHAAAKPEALGGAEAFAHAPDTTEELPILDARELVFRYGDRGRPILKDCDLQIFAGDRLLLEGSSGGGKSTLAALLVGVRQPESGLLLLGGLDYHSLGASGWRKKIVAAPQFHENHVLTGTFAFNLLMGRTWPPSAEDMQLAEEICLELGLQELLEKMPAGLLQVVGDTGWQLSHGERSRLFIARALLQGGELMLLDESFASLDPETLSKALKCVLRRAPALLVVAHP